MSAPPPGPADIHQAGFLDILEGECCEDLACPSRQCWPLPGESRAQFLARVGEVVRADQSRASGRWALNHDACRICGSDRLPHKGGGRCASCDSYWRRNGKDRAA